MSIFTNSTSPANEQKDSPSLESTASHAGETSAEQTPEALGLAGESVDFNSVLSAVSGNGAQDTAEESSQKDLNISSVIANIQDEGPAAQKGTPSAATHEPSKQAHKPLPAEDPKKAVDASRSASETSAAPAAEPTDHSLAPNSPVANAAAMTEVNNQATGSPTVPWTTILMRLVVTLLVVALAGMGYLLYTQGSGNQVLQSELLQLRQKLQETASSVAALSRQLQQQQKEMQDLVTSAQLQQRLESQRQAIDAWLQSRMADAEEKPAQPAELPLRMKPEQDKATDQAKPTSTTETRPAASPVADEGSNSAPKPIKPEKEIRTVVGQGGDAGRWLVHLASYGNRQQAEKALHTYANEVPDAGIQTALVKGRKVYRVSVTGFSTKQEALAYRDKMQRELGLKGVWIARKKK